MSVDEDLSAKLLAEAETRAAKQGSQDVAEYLHLRRRNDELRQAGVDALIQAFIDAAAPHMQARPRLAVERIDGHRFSHGSSTMTGCLLELRHGIRCLNVEAGWVRGPGDGVMLNGALAVAHVQHFGIPKADSHFKLARTRDTPVWLDEDGSTVDSADISAHLRLFLEL